MAISRGNMPNELFGNRQGNKEARNLARDNRKLARGNMRMAKPSMPATMPAPAPAPSVMKKGGVVKKAKGGSVRGCGCATRGKSGAKVY